MQLLALAIALATSICGVQAQNPGDNDFRQRWFLNVTVGGVFDEIPQCAKACTLGYLEMTGCNPLDPSCFCPIPDIAQGLDTCLAWFCPVLGYYDGLYLYHSTCNSPIRNQAAPLSNDVIAVASIAFVALILRFITRLPPLSVEWGIDDWLAAALVPVAGAYLAVILLAIDSGLGQDAWMLKPQKVADVVKYYTFQELGYVTITFMTKITVLAFYLRVFSIGRVHQLSYLFIGICTCLLISIFLAHLLQCLPISFLWQQWQGTLIPQPKNPICSVQRNNLNYAFNITNVIMDGIITVLPIPRLLQLKVTWQRKLGVLLVFCVGFLITGISVTRIAILMQSDFSYNRSWSNIPVVKWSAIEAFLSIAVTCFPPIHYLAKRIIALWYKPDDDATQQRHGGSKQTFASSSNAGNSYRGKGLAAYENIEIGERR
ncbi:hypothetical protein COCC4DRAFT_70125 [Bipolaris maydis ATCC 48331]|uniref:CFEM domain-containing protein n=3 Tax=Cochliobolus heterostrophus TaxID=5016 RepID=M2T9G0_COCH5|nr:uncharacterized protein COCC4DRAFT_70125 [Bipolaris maydis ATCC 48331]EMD93197.1 hypothetical protein COCHEDRAFT_1170626 [Bipolaris maydis C5]KAJ5026625.1 hypothetical protein J3E73DRAFT_381510 [Bipolaris maydis]EMD94190.1 hypothetical protein COCHEDRAFT_1130554 [Bipolaris maydis C5]ENI07510.1 hypothetical protein COCC4DRAFT_70125 [Bipolaris maydis ATCC 48331]KAJ6209635.1 hypothetical protein PSV09DRAFT_1130554 [Bipolaris maydis]